MSCDQRFGVPLVAKMLTGWPMFMFPWVFKNCWWKSEYKGRIIIVPLMLDHGSVIWEVMPTDRPIKMATWMPKIPACVKFAVNTTLCKVLQQGYC
jgi:hypothetical protein